MPQLKREVKTSTAVWRTPPDSGNAELDARLFELKDRLYQDRLLFTISECAYLGQFHAAEGERDYLLGRYGRKYGPLMKMILDEYVGVARRNHKKNC